MKATSIANSNTAFIKYWGKYDEKLILPMNNNLSLTVDSQNTTTTVEFSKDLSEDQVFLNKEKAEGKPRDRVVKHLDLIRGIANITDKAKVMTENNFPTAVGLASSASGFAALTVAACNAAGLELDKKQLSIISRQGSGSSCRSIYGGYVEWLSAKDSDNSYAVQLADENHFDIRDIAVVISTGKRPMGTREAMPLSIKTSPIYNARKEQVPKMIEIVKKAIAEKDFSLLGKTAESDAILMHAVMMTTEPHLFYWEPKTLELMKKVAKWRDGGLECYFTVDTGPNMHIFCLPENVSEIESRLKENGFNDFFISKPGGGADLVNEHLF
ncbi:MAG: diphosphomevalonate decarboxylase [Deltaproteobacteria bacterium]|nr:diphosphomevalonate decarboxylase [Deltaproteobacteria bacterium]